MVRYRKKKDMNKKMVKKKQKKNDENYHSKKVDCFGISFVCGFESLELDFFGNHASRIPESHLTLCERFNTVISKAYSRFNSSFCVELFVRRWTVIDTPHRYFFICGWFCVAPVVFGVARDTCDSVA